MNHSDTEKKFIFSEGIDNSFIFNMYESDYAYIREVFTTSLETLNEDIQYLHHAYLESDLEGIRRSVHKLKPIFGFSGLLAHQQKIEGLESQCEQLAANDILQVPYKELIAVFNEGKDIIEKEHQRLNEYLQTYS